MLRKKAKGNFFKSIKEVILDYFQSQKPSSEDKQIITCDNLIKIYKIEDLEVMALQGLELNIGLGEMVGIIGSSGSGKSTLLNILGGLDEPTAGKASVAGWDLNNMGYRDKIIYKREVVGFIWQNIGRNLVPYLTALENVRLPMVLKGNNQLSWAKELLEAVGLKDRMNHRPQEMSGGQQQRVAIAIALANRPKVLLADEPTGSLDSATGMEILRVFKDISQRYNVTVIVVTHDRSLARLVDRVVEIRDGKISTESVRRKPISELDLSFVNKDNEKTHTNYITVDSAGRLQLPADIRKQLKINNRVALRLEDKQIIITSPEN